MGYIFYILIIPNYVLGVNISHVTNFLPFLKKGELTLKKNKYFFIFFIYILYELVRNIIYIIVNINSFILDDLSDFYRIFILVIAFLLARKVNFKESIYYTFLFSISILLYLFGADVYSTGYRFSSFMPSVNYIWVPIFFLFIYGRTLYREIDKITLAVIALFLSASITSIIVIICMFIIYILVYNKNYIKPLVSFSAIVILAIIIGDDILSLFLKFKFNISKISTFVGLLMSGDVTQFHSFALRLNVWSDAWQLISEKPIFGWGVSKELMRYTDNAYLLTLFRYGFIGLLLELLVLIGMLYKSFKESKIIIFIFVIGLLISSIPANSFYEIKIIPILGLFVGEVFKYDSSSNINYE